MIRVLAFAIALLAPVSALAQVSPFPFGATPPIVGLPAFNPSSPITPTSVGVPASTCAAPGIYLTTAPTNGMAFTATPSVIICVNGVAILTSTSTAVTSTVPGLWPDAAGANAPSLAAKDNTDTGISFAASTLRFSMDGTYYVGMFATEFQLQSATSIGWSSGNIGASSDVSLSRLAAGVVAVGANQAYGLASAFAIRTAPAIASGFGTSPSIPNSNGTAAFTINVGTGGTASSGVITMPAATTGWVVDCVDITNAASFVTVQTAGTTTSVTLTNYSRTTGLATAWTASDILRCKATAY